MPQRARNDGAERDKFATTSFDPDKPVAMPVIQLAAPPTPVRRCCLGLNEIDCDGWAAFVLPAVINQIQPTRAASGNGGRFLI